MADGTIKVEKKFEGQCRKHGRQTTWMTITIDGSERHFCLACLGDILAVAGAEISVHEIKEKTGQNDE